MMEAGVGGAAKLRIVGDYLIGKQGSRRLG